MLIWNFKYVYITDIMHPVKFKIVFESPFLYLEAFFLLRYIICFKSA